MPPKHEQRSPCAVACRCTAPRSCRPAPAPPPAARPASCAPRPASAGMYSAAAGAGLRPRALPGSCPAGLRRRWWRLARTRLAAMCSVVAWPTVALHGLAWACCSMIQSWRLACSTSCMHKLIGAAGMRAVVLCPPHARQGDTSTCQLLLVGRRRITRSSKGDVQACTLRWKHPPVTTQRTCPGHMPLQQNGGTGGGGQLQLPSTASNLP